MSKEATTEPASLGRSPKVSGSSFCAAMRVLPREQRRAMFAIYGFCRAVGKFTLLWILLRHGLVKAEAHS